MTCGLGLGILLICLVQAEHVCCLWAEEAQSFQKDNTYAGFPLSDGGLGDFSSSPQNQLGQGFISPRSVQSSSFNLKPAANSVYGQGLSTRSNTQALSQPAQSSVRLVKISSVSKPNWQSLFSPRASPPMKPKQVFGLSTAVASGASVSHSSEKQTDLSRGPTWPAQQGSPGSGKYLLSSSPSVWSPSRDRLSVSSQSAAQKPFNYGQVGSSAILFGPVAPGPRGRSVRMQTYARAPAKRVISTRGSGGPARRVSSWAWKPSKGPGGSDGPRSQLQSYKPSLVSQVVYNLAVPRSSTLGASAQGSAPATVHEIPDRFGGSAIRRLREPAEQKSQQIPTALQWMAAHNPHFPGGRPESEWSGIKLYTL